MLPDSCKAIGTYTGKVPIYNSLKACNGTMFFLPLPLNKTLDTLHQANFSGKGVTALPDPELYIIVNGNQARGAPHYHVLLWIKDAPVIGRDDPDVVLSWMQERITCNIPNKQSDSELHSLVTRYQLHKCSRYCKRRRKCGNTYITRCRFGFPR